MSNVMIEGKISNVGAVNLQKGYIVLNLEEQVSLEKGTHTNKFGLLMRGITLQNVSEYNSFIGKEVTVKGRLGSKNDRVWIEAEHLIERM